MIHFPRNESMDPRNWGKMAFGWACQQAKIWGWSWYWDKGNDSAVPCYLITIPNHGEYFAETDHDFVKLVSDWNHNAEYRAEVKAC